MSYMYRFLILKFTILVYLSNDCKKVLYVIQQKSGFGVLCVFNSFRVLKHLFLALVNYFVQFVLNLFYIQSVIYKYN